MSNQILELDNVQYKDSPASKSWSEMRYRCFNPNCKTYKYYGGRGITICDRWKSFKMFLLDMGERPKGMSIERKDNSKGYYPENCKWATCFEQQNNTRKNKLFVAFGPSGQEELAKNQQAFARKFNLLVGNLNKCLKGERFYCSGWRFMYVPEDFPRYEEILKLFDNV